RRHTVDVLDSIGWIEDSPERERAVECLDALCRELPPDLEVALPEWLKLVSDRLQRAGEVALGGRGAGVQVLTVVEARARTFERLLVGGVSRGVFPRVVHEDPMLPEAVRARLAADVLPEMPVKGRSADEERYLFAQLLSSSPAVELSWHLYGPDGTLTPSPFVDRLRLRGDVGDPQPVPQLWPVEDSAPRPRPAYELAVLAAPRVDRNGFQSLLGSALAEDLVGENEETTVVASDELAAARADVLAAVEVSPATDDPGPWFGFAGAADRQIDGPMWVTRLEATGTCPWRAFVHQRLGIFPLPDPHLGLPGIDATLVGQVVHGVLERIVLDAIEDPPGDLGSVIAGPPAEVSWPPPARFDELLQREAERVARREGLATIGMAPLLEARARQFLATARAIEWGPDGTLSGVLAPEVEGTIAVRGVERSLAFRADRVDVGADGPELVDYKAAKPLSTVKTDDIRESHLLDLIARGRLLQAATYAGAAGAFNGVGRYLYLKPDDRWTDEMRSVIVRGDDEEVVARFEEAVRTIAEGRARGIVFPRLEEADGKNAEHCRFCRVAEACRRDDSGFRRRLVDWMQAEVETEERDAGAARALWWLGVDRDGGED
ncbi:MAG: PD-(D/E)XK nuclease family protein, partial [Thermoanaerobaculales bacterium]|nr:PD-(D/E)XK nuclease family protein [Thermoanaerobaculales bacterium]